MDLLHEIWQRAVAEQPRPTGLVVALTGLLALALVWHPRAWAVTRHLDTIAHEGAHGLAAVLTGRRLTGIRLHSDTSGLTVSSGRPRGPGMVLTLLAGYLGSALLGLGAASLLRAGHAVGLLWVLLVLLALLLLQIRNFFGLWSVLVTAALVFAVSWLLPAQVQSAFAYLVTWFLLLSAPRPVLELQRSRQSRRMSGSDADQLARLTWLPGGLWVGFFWLGTVGILLLGASLVVR